MTRDEAKRQAWSDWSAGIDLELMQRVMWPSFMAGFDAGWAAAPNLQPVIDWLEAGCDPLQAAQELRIYQSRRDEK